jgi:hypothetical protein
MTSLPQRQHLLLVGWIAVRLNERARSDGQRLFLMPSHVLHLSGDGFRHIPHPTFFNIQHQNSNGSIVLPRRRLRSMVDIWTKCRSCSVTRDTGS